MKWGTPRGELSIWGQYVGVIQQLRCKDVATVTRLHNLLQNQDLEGAKSLGVDGTRYYQKADWEENIPILRMICTESPLDIRIFMKKELDFDVG